MSGWEAITWTVARAGGITAYVLLTTSVALGLALSMRWQRPRWPRLVTNEMHTFLTGLSLVFMCLHGLAVWIDPFTRFDWREIFIPLVSHYRPVWVGLGIVGLYVVVAVWISTRVRSLIGYALWRRLHTLAFAAYALATVHGLATGSDTRAAWALAIYAGSVLLIGVLLGLRLLTPLGARGHTYPRLAALTALAVFICAAWTVAGPLRPGWNAVANNGQGTGVRGVGAAGHETATVSFSAGLQGTLTQSDASASGLATMRIATTLNDGTRRTLAITVQGEPDANGALAVTDTRVTLNPPASGPFYQGRLTALSGGRQWHMTAAMSSSGAQSRDLRLAIDLAISDDGRVSGTVQGTPGSAGAG